MSKLHFGTNNMDCLEGLRALKENSIDMVITSPPYDNLKTYNGYCFDFESIAKELYRVMKDGGVIVWNVGDATEKGSETGTSFRQALYFKEVGFNLHDTMIWHKPNAFNFGSNYCYKQSFEYMFIISKGKPKSINFIKDVPTKSAGKVMNGACKKPDGTRIEGKDFVCEEYKKRDNVWDINVSSVNNGHPAVFPEQLAEDHILSWSSEGDIIMDIFSGSGTTHKMSLKNKRKFIGFELSDEYVKIEEERIKSSGLWCYDENYNIIKGCD